MSLFYEKLLRPLLFKLDPEKAHEWTFAGFKALCQSPLICQIMQHYNQVHMDKPIELFGLQFPNAVGLAAGVDKNGQFWRAAGALGFGHVEIGTVTCKKQCGNPRPHLFRYPEVEAVVNRAGFNNDGSEALANRLRKVNAHQKRNIILGINIGKSKETPLAKAAEDYLELFHLLADYADYFTINVSSPNTPELRNLQERSYLIDLLKPLKEANENRARKLGVSTIPMLVKIAPDLSFNQIDAILEVILEQEISGIVATNTTIKRTGVASKIKEKGGLSGVPLHADAVNKVKYIHRTTKGTLPIIGVGGINDGRSAGMFIDAGASLVQFYTGMIFKGPFLAKTVAQALRNSQGTWFR